MKNATLAQQHHEKKIAAFQQALAFDRATPHQLSARIYASMKHGLPEADKINAIEREIKQGGSGDSDDQFIQLHWSRVNELQKAGRDDEARQALSEMEAAIQERGLKNPDYQKIVQRAHASLQNQQNTPTTQTATTNQKQIQTDANQPANWLQRNTGWIVLSVFLLVLITGVFIRSLTK